MKFSSALTLTTVVSIMSTVHGAPVPNTDPIHYRRYSSVSELSGRHLSEGADFMSSLGAAFEPGNGIGKLLKYVKRQLGSTDSTSATLGSGNTSASSSTSTGVSASYSKPYNAPIDNSNGPSGLMGGGLSSTQEAGFAFEPGQSLGGV